MTTIIGLSKIHGAPPGVKKDSLLLPLETHAVLLHMHTELSDIYIINNLIVVMIYL